MLSGPAKPFIKWVGGKARYAQQIWDIIDRLPHNSNYHEPFLGSGAMFLHNHSYISTAQLSDINPKLINLWSEVKANPDRLISKIDTLWEEYEETDKTRYYYKIRNLYNANTGDPTEQAAYLVFLNKTGYNGLYRENRQGQYNVSKGQYKVTPQPPIGQILHASQILQTVDITNRPYGEARPAPNDIIYLDPPYDAGFTKYYRQFFTLDQHKQLAVQANIWRDEGAYPVISYADTALIRALYKGWDIHTVEVYVNTAQYAKDRRRREELLIVPSCTR